MAKNVQGQFLVAASHLRDSSFFRSVILVLEHSEESAMGIVINRPSSIAIDAAVAEMKPLTSSSDPIYSGGPVETTALFILHNSTVLGQADREVAPGVFLTSSNDSFESLVNTDVKSDQKVSFRIYCGYAGWSAGQLDGEIERGDWRSLPASQSFIFNEDPYEVWDSSTRQIQQQSRLLPHNVRNANWN